MPRAYRTMKSEGDPPRPTMIAKATPSVSYSLWLRKILDTHRRQDWDAPPSESAEREEEVLNDLWAEIEDGQKQRLWGLSSDLNTLRDKETWVEADWPPMTRQEIARAQQDAFQGKQWDKFLELLRRPPRFNPRDMVDYLRGRAWMEMGQPDVALLFFDNAARLAPDNSTYLVLALECVKELQDLPEVLKRCQSYLHDPGASPRLLFRAGDGFHLYAKHSGEKEYYERAVAAIDSGFQRLAQAGQQNEQSSVIAAAYATKSFSLEQLNRPGPSLEVLNEAVARFPKDTTLLTARGLLKLELGRVDAIDDFRLAASNGGPVTAWVYAELARRAILEDENVEALDFCGKGIAVARQDAVAAFLHQWEAIALFRLHKSRDEVRTAFHHSLLLNPLSEETRINSERFEKFVANPHGAEPQWELVATPTLTAREDLLAVFAAAA